jgi:hypothetical protein
MVRPVTLFWLGHAVAVIIICREWIAYIRAAVRIRAVARSEGKDWPFTKDPKYQTLFVYSPESLLEPDDSPRLRGAKAHLLSLRARMWRIIFMAIAISASGVVAAAALTILYDR